MEEINGIILKKIDYKESSSIAYVYTAKGLVSVLVHGARKINSKHLNLIRIGQLVKFQISGKDLKTLRDGDIVRHFQEITADLEKFTYTTHLLELIYSFAQHDHDHEKLYQFLLKIMGLVADEKAYIPYINMAELKLLYLLGVNPLFKHCVSCERKDHLQFSIVAGGMCCPDHLDQPTSVSNHVLKAMMMLYYFDLAVDVLEPIPNQTLIGLRQLLDDYYAYHLNTKTKSRQLLKGLIGY